MRVLVVVAVVLAYQSAEANPPLAEPPAQPAVASYRGATLTADGVSVGLVVLSDLADAESLVWIGISTYVVGAPFVHLTKGRPGRAAASLAMRVGLPALGLVIGDSIPRDCGICGGPPGAVYLGLAAGVVTASALDAIFLAKGDATPPAVHAGWTPVAGPTRDGFALGVVGHF